MRGWRHRGLFAVLVGVGVPGQVMAGVSVGDRGNLSLSLASGLTWRSNVYRADSDPVTGLEWNVAPRANLDFRDDRLVVTLDGGYQLRKFLLGGQSNLDRFDTFDVSGKVDVLPEGLLGLRLNHTTWLTNNPIDSLQAEDPYTTQLKRG